MVKSTLLYVWLQDGRQGRLSTTSTSVLRNLSASLLHGAVKTLQRAGCSVQGTQLEFVFIAALALCDGAQLLRGPSARVCGLKFTMVQCELVLTKTLSAFHSGSVFNSPSQQSVGFVAVNLSVEC